MKIKDFTVNFGRKYLPGMFDQVNLSKEFGIEMSESQALYF